MASFADTIAALSPSADASRAASLALVIGDKLDATVWGDDYTLALAYLTLHEMETADASATESGSSAAGGPAVRVRTGGEEVQFGSPRSNAVVSSIDAELMETTWGRKYIAFRDSRLFTLPFAVGAVTP